MHGSLVTRRRTPGQPDWPNHRSDAPPSDDPRSLRRGLLAGAALLLIAAAVLLAGGWSTQTSGLVAMLSWIAAVGFGALAYRGRPPWVLTATKLSIVLGLVALALVLLLVLVGGQVRDILVGTVTFGPSGSGCTLDIDAESFMEGEPIYQVAHLARPVQPGEPVAMVLSQDGAIVAQGTSTTEHAFDCMGTPLEPLAPGSYTVVVSTADEPLAEGRFEVRPESE